MNMITKNNIYREHLGQWLRAKRDKRWRGEIIDHICFVTGAHRKSVPRSFKRIQMASATGQEQRGREIFYTNDVIAALKDVWNIASEPCAENLHAVCADYVRILKRDGVWNHSDQATEKLLVMSLGTMKKRVAQFARKQFVAHGKSSTKAGAIHALIPIRRGDWDVAPAGTCQIDTVAHCGHTLADDFIYTVNSTDVATLWGARRAQLNKGQEVTIRSMECMEQDIPFMVVEWHPDSGSEFINWQCYDWCMARKVKLTRSRPNRKNDNCFVEERNGHVVRRWVGYSRLDAREVVDALNAVYDVLTPYLNHFVASRRIVSKERVGAQWKVKREPMAKTPYQRVLERNDVDEKVKMKLRNMHETLNPLAMKTKIDRRLEKVFNLQKHHGKPNLQK
jgi:hypothetical protein